MCATLVLHPSNGPAILTDVYERNRLVRRHNTRITDLLKQRRLRADWLAERMGVSYHTFWRYETGRAAPPTDWYERAAEVLDVPVSEIVPHDQADVAA